MIRLVDDEKFIEILDEQQVAYYILEIMAEFFEMTPTVDAVEVVRCKECIYAHTPNEGYNPEDMVCTFWQSDGLKETDYCSMGKRK